MSGIPLVHRFNVPPKIHSPYGWLENYSPNWAPNTTDAEERPNRFGHHVNVQEASLVLVDPQTDNTVQDVSYIFQTHGKAIRSGMNVSTWIP